jgi:hypothetical protein
VHFVDHVHPFNDRNYFVVVDFWLIRSATADLEDLIPDLFNGFNWQARIFNRFQEVGSLWVDCNAAFGNDNVN